MGQGKSTTTQAPTGPGVEAYNEFAAPAATALASTEFTPYTGSFAPGMSDYTTQAGQLYGDIAQMGQMTPQDYAARTQANMNPYQSQVIDTSLARMGRQQEQSRMNSQADMIKSGAFGGGGRRAVYEAEFDTGNLANQNQLISEMMQAGYTEAQAQTMAQIEQQQGALGAGAAGLSGVGATDTALQGAQMAGDYGEFMRQQDDPYNRLNAFTGLASGSPTGATSTETRQPGLFEYLTAAAGMAS
tara:strand:- start:365 stop:1096 length:732 start_codon:yes stop_codon:yes gene_type:complete